VLGEISVFQPEDVPSKLFLKNINSKGSLYCVIINKNINSKESLYCVIINKNIRGKYINRTTTNKI
jgi:hypothetical protein